MGTSLLLIDCYKDQQLKKKQVILWNGEKEKKREKKGTSCQGTSYHTFRETQRIHRNIWIIFHPNKQSFHFIICQKLDCCGWRNSHYINPVSSLSVVVKKKKRTKSSDIRKCQRITRQLERIFRVQIYTHITNNHTTTKQKGKTLGKVLSFLHLATSF